MKDFIPLDRENWTFLTLPAQVSQPAGWMEPLVVAFRNKSAAATPLFYEMTESLSMWTSLTDKVHPEIHKPASFAFSHTDVSSTSLN